MRFKLKILSCKGKQVSKNSAKALRVFLKGNQSISSPLKVRQWRTSIGMILNAPIHYTSNMAKNFMK